jgi:AcrR family transcriptional regulator
MSEVLDRRDVILSQAAKLFARKGVSATTVREIGDAAGILSGSLYHHFESKEAIVDEILASYLDNLLAWYRQVTDEHDDPKECLAGLIRVSFQSIEEYPEACEIYQNDFNYLTSLPRFGYLQKKAAEFQKAWVDVIMDGVDQGQFRGDVDPRVFYRFARDALWLTVRWYKPGGRHRIEELAEECIAVLMDGYATSSNRSRVANNGERRGRPAAAAAKAAKGTAGNKSRPRTAK